jgi:hypothetical protein
MRKPRILKYRHLAACTGVILLAAFLAGCATKVRAIKLGEDHYTVFVETFRTPEEAHVRAHEKAAELCVESGATDTVIVDHDYWRRVWTSYEELEVRCERAEPPARGEE